MTLNPGRKADHKIGAASERRTDGACRERMPGPNEAGQRAASNPIALAIGSQVRDLRSKLNLTGVELAAQAGLSGGMVSKIENGTVLPSIDTLDALARVFNVPLTTLLARYDERRDCTYVPRGKGLLPAGRRGDATGYRYELLGHSISNDVIAELYHVQLGKKARSPEMSSYPGTEFIYVLRGRFVYQHAGKTYSLSPGDVLFFDSAGLHGPGELIETPVAYLSWRHRASNAVLA